VAKGLEVRKNFAPFSVNDFKDGDVQVVVPVLEHLFDRIKIGSDEAKIQHEEPS